MEVGRPKPDWSGLACEWEVSQNGHLLNSCENLDSQELKKWEKAKVIVGGTKLRIGFLK